MAIVTDPDNLDRFQIAVDPIAQTISIRGQDTGNIRGSVQQTGDSAGTTTFTDATNGDFVTDGVQVGDVLAIISDPADDGGIIGHYRVTGSIAATSFTVDRSIPASTAADLTYRIAAKQTTGGTTAAVADGVTLQCLYSFLKEEWKALAAGLGNAEDLMQFTFPITAITREQMIFGGVNGDASSAWSFASDNAVEATDDEGVPRELVRTGGWQEQNAAGTILREYIGVVTLGSIDSDAQVYFQQGDATGDPTDFKLTGPVNQAVLSFGPDVGPDAVATGFAFTATTITRNDGGNWATDNYRVGDYVQIRSAEDPANIGNFGPITAVADATDGAITIASASFTVNADDTTAIFQVDHRQYFKLFVRKKGKSYSDADLNNIGVTVLEALVNRFPLSHVDDPAITLFDGVLGGDGTTTGDIFQQVETHTTGSDGATQAAASTTATTFTFTSAGSTFNSTARSVQTLQPGDTLEITSGSDQGTYEIVSIDNATTLTCFKEPGTPSSPVTYTGGESTLNFTVRTRSRDNGAANATLTDVDGDTGTLVSTGSTFTTDDGLGDRTVQIGDVVVITAGDNAVIGYYKVNSITNATTLVLDTSDQIFSGETNQTYRINRPGMYLQRFETTAGDIANDPSFNDANPDTITRAAGSFVTDGYTAGGMVTVTNANTAANNGQFIIATSVALTLTLIAEEALTTDATDTSAVLAFETGIVRTINQVDYPFHWRLEANGGTLQDIFQWLQRQLRRTTDIDLGSGLARGDITDLLMSFASPTGTTLDLYPDNLASAESNNVTFRDMSGDDRNNAFLVGLTFAVNNNLINSSLKRLVAYFDDPDGSPASGDEFDSNGAIIVDDASGTDMDFSDGTITGNIQRTFDYTNNAQGGRTPGTDAAITVVAIGNDLAQYVLVSTTITQVNSLTIAVGTALERNYANP